MTACNHSNIARMDHRKGFDRDPGGPVRMVNRMCLRCGRHWYGPEGAVREFTRAEWAAWVKAAFNDTPTPAGAA